MFFYVDDEYQVSGLDNNQQAINGLTHCQTHGGLA